MHRAQDYCCIDQDGAPASELDNLGNLMEACDLMLTPVVDVDHQKWKRPQDQGKVITNWFDEYLAPGWKEYWSRGWCRVEAMLSAACPVDAALQVLQIERATEVARRCHLAQQYLAIRRDHQRGAAAARCEHRAVRDCEVAPLGCEVHVRLVEAGRAAQ